ncbi:MAG: hypothetical protein RL268_40 [Pseudomonadota bacterium]
MLAAGQLLNVDPLDHDPDSHPEPDAEVRAALAAFGLHLADECASRMDEVTWIWPENERAWRLWLEVQTQWRVGFDGKTGLDYAGVQACMELRRIPRRVRSGLFRLLHAMELAALGVWREARERGGS